MIYIESYIIVSERVKRNISLILILFLIVFLAGCNPETSPKVPEKNYNEGITYIPNMRTPYGTRLLPAEEGPIRSALGEPTIDLNTFKLEITGLVDSTYSLTWDEIKIYPKHTTKIMLMYCVEGWEVWGQWEGILVSDLLKAAGIKPTGEHVFFSSVDGYSTSLPVTYLENYDAILALKVNGSELQKSDGFPIRLVAFGKFGYKWIKWVNNLEVVDRSKLGFWESDGYDDEANVPISRRMFYEREDAKPLEY